MANKYLHLFETEQQFQTAYNGNDYEEPGVSFTNLTNTVNYNRTLNNIEEPEEPEEPEESEE